MARLDRLDPGRRLRNSFNRLNGSERDKCIQINCPICAVPPAAFGMPSSPLSPNDRSRFGQPYRDAQRRIYCHMPQTIIIHIFSCEIQCFQFQTLRKYITVGHTVDKSSFSLDCAASSQNAALFRALSFKVTSMIIAHLDTLALCCYDPLRVTSWSLIMSLSCAWHVAMC